MGRPAAGAGVPEKQKPRTRKHPKRQAGSAQHDQFLLWPANWISNLCVSADHLLLQLAPATQTHPGRTHQHRKHSQLCCRHLAQVWTSAGKINSTKTGQICKMIEVRHILLQAPEGLRCRLQQRREHWGFRCWRYVMWQWQRDRRRLSSELGVTRWKLWTCSSLMPTTFSGWELILLGFFSEVRSYLI